MPLFVWWSVLEKGYWLWLETYNIEPEYNISEQLI
jgi:hypothetical protein